MRLNCDCVRDIMLWAEAITTPNRFAVYVDTDSLKRNGFMYAKDSDKPVPNKPQQELLAKYSNEVLVYHINYCLKARFLEGSLPDMVTYKIDDLTPEGHQFMANIRSNTVFNKTKEIGKKLGVESLMGFARIAEGIVAETIRACLANPQ